MKQLTILLMTLLVLSLDSIVIPQITFWGIRPSLVLCLVLSLGVRNGRFTGAMAGLTAGVLMDFLYGPRVGYYSLIMLLVGYFSSSIYINRFSDSVVMLAVYTAAAFCAMQVLMVIASRMIGAETENVLLLFLRYVIPSALVTGICMIPVNAIVKWVFHFSFMKKRWRISSE